MLIKQVEKVLTDGSKVYDVELHGDDSSNPVVLRAITEPDAHHMIRVMKVAIEYHTTDTVETEGWG